MTRLVVARDIKLKSRKQEGIHCVRSCSQILGSAYIFTHRWPFPFMRSSHVKGLYVSHYVFGLRVGEQHGSWTNSRG